MTAKKRAPRRLLGSDLKRVDAHVIRQREYDELPKLTGDMLARGKVNKDRRPHITKGTEVDLIATPMKNN